jgi:hypothetical protein
MIEPGNIEIVYFFQFGAGVQSHKIASVMEFVDSKEYIAIYNSTAPSTEEEEVVVTNRVVDAASRSVV